MTNKGFTLIELMITVSVLAISVAIAVPSFNYVMQSNRVSSKTNAVIGAFNLARVEAIKRGTSVIISSSDTSVVGNNWGLGFRVWIDLDSDSVYDVGEELRVFESLPNGITLDGANTTYTFRSTGFLASSGTLNLCSDFSGLAGRQMSLALSGRIQTSQTACP